MTVVTVCFKINYNNSCFCNFCGKILKKSGGITIWKKILDLKIIEEFKKHLILEERSTSTVEKYIRDVKSFADFVNGDEITKETVINYKKYLQENYAVRSVNSMLASINSMFAFLDWHELKVKSIKLQQQIYCPEEKELTKAEYARLCRTANQKHNKRVVKTVFG